MTTSASLAADLVVLAPAVANSAGLGEITRNFTKETGIPVTVRSAELLKIADTARTGQCDIVFLTPELLASMAEDKSIQSGSSTPIGRVDIGLAVMAGSPHPDISTTSKLIAVLKSAKAVVYSNPDPARGSMAAMMVDRLLKRPDFAGIHSVISSKGNGVSGLIAGEGDMALQNESEILPHSEIELVGPLPHELGAFINISAAVSAKSSDPDRALAFIHYLKTPEATAIWQAKGLTPN